MREGRLDEQVPASYAVGALHASSPISHVIPLRLPQTLKWHRWNCNVLGGARKMTVGNYVRLLSGKVRRYRCCPAGALQAFLTNFARNSPTATSNLEMASLELQRFGRCSKNHRGKLCATFIRQGAAIPLWPRSGPAVARRPGRRPRNPPESRHCLVQVSPHSSFGPAVRGKYLGHNGNGGRPPTPARSVLTPGRRRGLAA